MARKWLVIAALTIILMASVFQAPTYATGSYDDYMSEGRTLFQQGHFAEAVDSFSQAITLNSNSSEALKFRGISYYFIGNISSALADLSTIPETDSNGKLTREEFCLFITKKLGLSPVTSPDMQFTDVDGNRWSAPYIYAVSQEKIMNGYIDAHFGPEESFTRAELARRLETIMRKKYHAPISTPDRQYYTDVAANDWAYSYIELMGSFNIIPAQEDGSFLPEQNTSVADLIEALEKLPVGDLNDDDLINFNDLTAAAAVYAGQNQAADLNGDGVVDLFDLNVISRQIGNGYTIIQDEFVTKIMTPDALIMDYSIDSSGGYVVWYYTYDNSSGEISSLKSASLEPNCLLGSSQTVLGMVGHFCDLYWDEAQKVDSVVLKDYCVLTSDKLLVFGGKVKVNDVEYAFVPTNIAVEDFEAAPNGLLLSPQALADNIYDAADTYKVVLNKDNQVCAIIARTLPLPGIVQNVEGNVIQFGNTPPVKDLTVRLSSSGEWSGFDDRGNFTGCSVVVERDGKFSSLDHIQPLNVVNVLKDYRGVDYYLNVSSEKLNGKFTNYKTSDDDITNATVESITLYPGNKVDTYDGFYYWLDGGYIYGSNPNPTILKNALQKEASILLGATGKVACLITIADTDEHQICAVGIITKMSPLLQSKGESEIPFPNGSYYRKVEIFEPNSTISQYYITDDSFIAKNGPRGFFKEKIIDLSHLHSYTDTSYSLQNIEGLIQAFAQSDELVSGLVGITYNAAGIATCIYVTHQTEMPLNMEIMDTDNDLIKLNGEWYDANGAVILNLNNGVGGPATSTADLVNTTVEAWTILENSTGVTVRGYQVEAPWVDYLIVNGMVPSPVISQYGIYLQQSFVSNGLRIFLKGKEMNELYKAGTITPTTLTKGDVVRYTTQRDTINILEVVIPYGSTSNTIVEKIERGIIILDDQTAYTFDENTLFFDICDCDNLQILDSLSVGDIVKVIPDETNSGRAALISVVQ